MNFIPSYVQFAVTRSDGGVSVVSYTVLGRGSSLPDGASWFDQESGTWTRPARADLVEAEVRRAVPDALSWRQVVPLDLPARDDYRNAWKDADGRVSHDMPKARELHRNLLRHERARVFPSLDGQWARAMGQGDTAGAAEVEALRQRWRDAPADPRIEAAKSVEELKNIVPMV